MSTLAPAAGVAASGLTSDEARSRLQRYGPNSLGERSVSPLVVLARQVRNPLLMLLCVTAVVSALVGEHADAYIIIVIVALSVGLGFVNEYRSERAMQDLRRSVAHRAVVVRDGAPLQIDVAEVVPGDVVLLGIGDIVAADVRLIDVQQLSCNESVLTGEAVPVEKIAGPAGGGEGDPSACAFMGTTVEAGEGSGIVFATGSATRFGTIAAHLAEHPPETAFEAGLRGFSQMLVMVTMMLTASIFVLNALLRHPIVDSLLFSLAIAVGLTPQLLPAIVTVSLATGAQRLARRKVVVKRLVSIEDFGNVEVLFTDKTGTLTQGDLRFERAIPVGAVSSSTMVGYALCCSDVIATGERVAAGTPLDRALFHYARESDLTQDGLARVSSAPYDYVRKMMSVLVRDTGGRLLLVTKGAPELVMSRCIDVSADARRQLDDLFRDGARVIAVATRPIAQAGEITAADERGLSLCGFLVFSDPVKPSAGASIARLQKLGVDVRIITGDNEKVALKVCAELGMDVKGVMSGAQIDALADRDLQHALSSTTIFARVTPEQKSRIIRLQRALGTDVGFLGDGVNDAVAIHLADVGISVDSATDVAKDAADIILLDKDLGILADGVVEGRRIFTNTIKYVLMGTSSNFGNMFSAAGASLFLSFLPMTAPQILLNNLLYDTSEMAIPTDEVDEELLARPSHWDVEFIRRFMLLFGPISSIFDYATFAVMSLVFHAHAALFQSGWFVESLATQSLIIFVIRTRRIPFFKSKPSVPLLVTTVAVVLLGAAFPYTPLAPAFGFTPLPARFFAILVAMIVAYLALVELGKSFFYRRPVAVRQKEARAAQRVGRVAARWID